jgi:hypothetical protein
MLKQEIKSERIKRYTDPKYQYSLNLFLKKMSTLHQKFEKKNNYKIDLLNQLTKNAIIADKKLNTLTALLNKQSILFNKDVQYYLINIAQKQMYQDSFSGKLLHFYFMTINKKKIDESIKQIKSYEQINPVIAEQIIQEEAANYKQNQRFLFFEILADLASTPEFKKVIQE